MDLSFLTDYYVPLVLVACLVIGFCIKNIKWLDVVADEYIPTILAVIGAVLACINVGGVSLQDIVAGAVTGLASTGLHQAFTQIINGHKNTEIE